MSKNILLTLGAETASFEASMKKAASSVTQIQSAISTIQGASFVYLGRQVLQAASEIYNFVSGITETAKEIEKASQKVGMSTDELQAWRYAAKMAGVDSDSFTNGIKFLGRNMEEASKGTGKAVLYFQQMGIPIKNAVGGLRPFNDVLGDVADKFSSWEDSPKKVAIAIAMFGRNGIEMVPILNKGRIGIEEFLGSANKLGQVLSPDLVKKGAEMQDQFKKMETAISTLKASFLISATGGEQFGDVIAGIAKRISDIVTDPKFQMFAKLMTSVFPGMAGIPIQGFTGINKEQQKYFEALDKFGEHRKMTTGPDIEDLKVQMELSQVAIKRQQTALKLNESEEGIRKLYALQADEISKQGIEKVEDLRVTNAKLAANKDLLNMTIDIWRTANLQKGEMTYEGINRELEAMGKNIGEDAVQITYWNDDLQKSVTIIADIKAQIKAVPDLWMTSAEKLAFYVTQISELQGQSEWMRYGGYAMQGYEVGGAVPGTLKKLEDERKMTDEMIRLKGQYGALTGDIRLQTEALKEENEAWIKANDASQEVADLRRKIVDEQTMQLTTSYEFLKGYGDTITNSMSSNLTQVIQGTEKMSDALKKIWSDLASYVISQILKMVANYALFGNEKGTLSSGQGLLGNILGLFKLIPTSTPTPYSAPSPFTQAPGWAEEMGSIPGFGGNFQHGTDYVPKTGLALLHQGEAVVPAGQNKGGGDTYVTNQLIQIPDPNSFVRVYGGIMKKVSEQTIAEVKRYNKTSGRM